MKNFNRIKGFGLVELLVALTIGLILIAVVFQVFISNKESYQILTTITNRDEGARYSLDLITNEVKTLGYRGCVREDGKTSNNLDANNYQYNFSKIIDGYEGQRSGFSPELPFNENDLEKNSDVLVLRPTEPLGFDLKQNMGVSSGLIVVNNNSDINSGDVVSISDCAVTSIFGVSSFSNGVVGHIDTPALAKSFNKGSQIHKLFTVAYFVKPSQSNNTMSLYRKKNDEVSQELIEGVESIQILFGVDTDKDYSVDVYQNANNVNDWEQIISLKIALLMSTNDENITRLEADNREFKVLDKTFGPFNDKKIRKVYEKTITIRNRLP